MRPYYEAMAVTPSEVEDLERWAQRAIEKGATALVLRLSRGLSANELERWARTLPESIPWIVHASWAVQPYGWGMHFPAPPTPPGPKIAPDYLYGQSCHSEEEVAAAASWASYVWIGAFFHTPSHPERRTYLPLDVLSRLRERYPTLPLVAIGGIDDDEKIKCVKEAGAWGFAGVRYFL